MNTNTDGALLGAPLAANTDSAAAATILTQPHREPNDQQLFDAGREMVRAYHTDFSRHDLLVILIAACIAEGIDTRDGIIAMVPKVGVYRHAHVAHTLDSLTGENLETSNWQRADDGKYRLLAA